ncbi:DUF2069 domain-containing protein [Glaciecola sp. 2405UD65-10]|uniref:DUF2069 domain-containing protein n=1 Tax=Glaciecola sp. 2405UD65-10 TaxID=3397244 RepID=UPI003B58BBE5
MTTNIQQIKPMSSKVKSYRFLALISHIGLLSWLSIWYLLLNNSQQYSFAFVFIVYLLPLLLPLHGVIKAKPYTHAWACFIVLWYFLHGITVIYSEPSYIVHAIIELVLAIGMFAGCSLFARNRGQELGSALPKLSKVMEQEKEYFERNTKHDTTDA